MTDATANRMAELVAQIVAQEWLEEGIWCIFCGADRAENRIGSTLPQDPHADDCLWKLTKDAWEASQ